MGVLRKGRNAPASRPSAPGVAVLLGSQARTQARTRPLSRGLGRSRGAGAGGAARVLGGTTSPQERPVRCLAAPRHPSPPWPGGGPHARARHGDRPRREPGGLAQDGGPRSRPSGPWVPAPRPRLRGVGRRRRLQGCRWPSLPRPGLGFCTWVDRAEAAVVWTCAAAPGRPAPRPRSPLCGQGLARAASEGPPVVQPQSRALASRLLSETAAAPRRPLFPGNARCRAGWHGRTVPGF